MTRYMKRRQEWNQSNLQLFPCNMTLKSHFTHMCPAKIFVSIVYLLDQNKPHSCLTHVMAHYCSKHTSYWKFRDHWKPCPWCNVCLERTMGTMRRSLIPQPKMATTIHIKGQFPCGEALVAPWISLAACITCFWCATIVTKRPYRFLNQKLQAGLSRHAETLMLPFPRVWAVPE